MKYNPASAIDQHFAKYLIDIQMEEHGSFEKLGFGSAEDLIIAYNHFRSEGAHKIFCFDGDTGFRVYLNRGRWVRM